MKHQIRLFLLLVFIYLVFALPFKAMNIIPGFTDVRPVSALAPIYGIFYGPLGCLACAIGNLIADIIDDALRWSSLAGFAATFLGPLMIWLLWKRFGRHPFALRTIPDFLFHTLVIVVVAIMQAAIITPAVAYAYPDVNAKLFAFMVLCNSTFFPIVLGIPLSIIMQDELGFSLYSEEKQATETKN